MKIKVYNQLLAASTLASGMIIFVALWHQNQKVEEISRAHFESRLIVQTIEHLFTMSQTWLTTQDLLFAGQQTYLANGITKQSKQLSETLLTIDVNVVSQSSHQLIEKLQAAISKNDVIVNSFSQFSIVDNKTWQAAIGQSDRVTTDYIKTLEQLLSETSKKQFRLS
jgi:hypothetical protein